MEKVCATGASINPVCDKIWDYWNVDALHLSIPAQGLPNGEAALQHAAAYPGMQPYAGVGKLAFFQDFIIIIQKNDVVIPHL